jgi:threonine dehydratase
MKDLEITLRDVYMARGKVGEVALRTPLLDAERLGKALGARVVLKAENLQETGSFKIRGAANKILSLNEAERRRGVLAVSTGNHGRAVAYVAQRVGVPAVVCVSAAVPENKLAAIRSLGAELVIAGETYDEAAGQAEQLKEARGLAMVHPFDDPDIIAGQGTIGVEVLEDFPEVNTVIVPLSGGGLIGGIGLALKSAGEDIRVIGVSMTRGPAMVDSLRAGRVVEVIEEPTLADALAGGIGTDNRHSFRVAQRVIDASVLVTESEIAGGMAYALDEHHLVLEGAGAVGLAALLYGKVTGLGKNVMVVLSGGNVEVEVLARIAEKRKGWYEDMVLGDT